jgi:hypothetical protein
MAKLRLTWIKRGFRKWRTSDPVRRHLRGSHNLNRRRKMKLSTT